MLLGFFILAVAGFVMMTALALWALYNWGVTIRTLSNALEEWRSSVDHWAETLNLWERDRSLIRAYARFQSKKDRIG